MRHSILFLILITISFAGWSQIDDTPKEKPLKIDVANNKDGADKAKKSPVLRMPSIVGNEQPINFKDSLNKKKAVKMYPNRDLVQAGTGMKIDPKVELQEEGSEAYFPDIYLGNVRSNSKFVGIVCRDGGTDIDGDRIKMIVNGKVVDSNILLTYSLKGVNVDLEKGINRIEFVALNEGSVSPNSAQVEFYEDNGELIFTTIVMLSKGSKASFVINKR